MPVLGSGKTLFQLVSVRDVARCIAQVVVDPRFIGQTVYFGGPQYISYEEIIDTVMTVLGSKKPKLHIPLPVMRPLVWLMERVMPHPPVTTHQLNMLSQNNITEPDAIEKAFGFRPTPLREGIDYIKRN